MKTIKIPPPILVIILTSLVYISSTKLELIYLPYRQIISILILVIGLIIIISPIVNFIKSKTTVNPVKFKNVNRLVTTGIYKHSRNPMYLGMIIVIISITVYYLNYLSVFSPLIFYIWINKFQISREEIFLEDKFGDEYLKYKSKTRRWI
tara:strand:- start:81837 stop:82286 length:450 start_codon:yes stop_codon:yes gene_type:complete